MFKTNEMSIEKHLTVGSYGAVDEVEVDVKAEHPSAHCRRSVLWSEKHMFSYSLEAVCTLTNAVFHCP